MAWGKAKLEGNHIQCSLCKPPDIFIEPIPRDKIDMLLAEYSHTEWIGYLVGQENKDSGDVFVEDVVIPPHEEASEASCLAEPFHIPKKGCVGVIHSHHSMGAFHSGQDDSTVDRNFMVSITVAKRSGKTEYDAICYMETACHRGTIQKCSVRYVQPAPLFNRKDFLDKAKANIDKAHKREVFIPAKYQKPYVIGKEGDVLTKGEYEKIMEGIWHD